jgi:hypothetical protein
LRLSVLAVAKSISSSNKIQVFKYGNQICKGIIYFDKNQVFYDENLIYRI